MATTTTSTSTTVTKKKSNSKSTYLVTIDNGRAEHVIGIFTSVRAVNKFFAPLKDDFKLNPEDNYKSWTCTEDEVTKCGLFDTVYLANCSDINFVIKKVQLNKQLTDFINE